jgi:hypothetical protein
MVVAVRRQYDAEKEHAGFADCSNEERIRCCWIRSFSGEGSS